MIRLLFTNSMALHNSVAFFFNQQYYFGLLPGLNRVSKKLDIDCAPAMVGWEFSGVSCHPVFDGFVVCEEHQDILMDAWNADEVERERRAHEKKTKRACDNWRKLTRAMLMYEKIRKKYAKKEAAEVVDDNCTKT